MDYYGHPYRRAAPMRSNGDCTSDRFMAFRSSIYLSSQRAIEYADITYSRSTASSSAVNKRSSQRGQDQHCEPSFPRMSPHPNDSQTISLPSYSYLLASAEKRELDRQSRAYDPEPFDVRSGLFAERSKARYPPIIPKDEEQKIKREALSPRSLSRRSSSLSALSDSPWQPPTPRSFYPFTNAGPDCGEKMMQEPVKVEGSWPSMRGSLRPQYFNVDSSRTGYSPITDTVAPVNALYEQTLPPVRLISQHLVHLDG